MLLFVELGDSAKADASTMVANHASTIGTAAARASLYIVAQSCPATPLVSIRPVSLLDQSAKAHHTIPELAF